MAHDDKPFIVGIDLGTTNSAVSYADLRNDQNRPEIKIFRIPQLTGPGEFAQRTILPSFLYLPGPYDISSSAISIPWEPEPDSFVGFFAREHGAKVPARLVSSSKSWLCHGNVDRRAKILPWGSGEEIFKVSPVAATAAFLGHIRKAWNSWRGGDEEQHLENQLVVITVPASFDEVARDLTLEAAKMAGFHEVTLLEEPLAAFYSWLIRHESQWMKFVAPNELILVCDVGGGTTDFTLIALRDVDGSPRFERIAVGDHLILGGDNIDFALARLVEKQAGKKNMNLSSDRWKALCHQCRQAKERILSGQTDSERITLMGEGGRLIAGILSAEIRREELEATVVEGFFPVVDPGTNQQPILRKGISELGLPFESEPAITRHLGWFLNHHARDVEKILGKPPIPDVILFNGGSLKPAVIQNRIRQAIRHWFQVTDEGLPRVLENPEPDLAVALGASYYGLVKTGRGVRVGSGSPRGYYLGISAPSHPEIIEEETRKVAVCLVERGLEEGSHINLKDKRFEVLANQPVSFDLYSSSYRAGDRSGDLVEIDTSLTALPPVQTVVQFGKKGMKTSIPVEIEADYTEIGSLALWCRSLSSSHRWRLQFQLRGTDSGSPVADSEVFDEQLVKQAGWEIERAFQPAAGNDSRSSLVKEIASLVERPKEKWPLSFVRRITDLLIGNKDARTISPEHESRWLNLAGFTARPGFGDSYDAQRIRELWKIYQQGPIFPRHQQVISEWWILWRRVAAGLNSGQQRQIIQDLTSTMIPKKGLPQKVPTQQHLEIWMAVANLERLLVGDKIRWGRYLLGEIKPKKTKPQLFWALSRMGARELLYGPVDRVIPPAEAKSWIQTLMEQNWRNPKPVLSAVIQMARRTGDRARDLEPAFIDQLSQWMERHDTPAESIQCLREIVPLASKEETEMFGESLPAGLVLHMKHP
ncbi:MAG: Hsp70 family protein [Thermodesulfobacteriota bacterium]